MKLTLKWELVFESFYKRELSILFLSKSFNINSFRKTFNINIPFIRDFINNSSPIVQVVDSPDIIISP